MYRIVSAVAVLAMSSACMYVKQEAPAANVDLGSQDAVEANIQRAFDDLVAAGFSGYIAVSIRGETAFARGHSAGEHLFQLNAAMDALSMTKSFTAAAVATLIIDGHLSPDTRLDEIWSDVPSDKAEITIHQLLTHAAGLPQSLGRDHDYIDRTAYLNLVWETPLIAAPGAKYAYSNTGYSVLAAIIETQTGVSFEAHLQEEIFAPLGMTNTGYLSACCAQPGSEHIAATSWGDTSRVSWNLIGNGGMLSTPSDMIKWVEGYESGALRGGHVRDLTHRPHQREGDSAPTYYGYGLVVDETSGFGPAYWHNGGSRAFNAHWRYYAEHDTVIVVAADQWDVNSDTAEIAIAGAFLDKGPTD